MLLGLCSVWTALCFLDGHELCGELKGAWIVEKGRLGWWHFEDTWNEKNLEGEGVGWLSGWVWDMQGKLVHVCSHGIDKNNMGGVGYFCRIPHVRKP